MRTTTTTVSVVATYEYLLVRSIPRRPTKNDDDRGCVFLAPHFTEAKRKEIDWVEGTFQGFRGVGRWNLSNKEF